MTLPPCTYRHRDGDAILCAHERVHAPGNRVPVVTCLRCRWHDKPCDNPRVIDAPRETADEPLPYDIIRIGRYLHALGRWAFAGCPRRTQEEIDGLLVICHGCEHFNREHHACGHPKCGCRVNSRQSLANKLALATEHCPIGEW